MSYVDEAVELAGMTMDGEVDDVCLEGFLRLCSVLGSVYTDLLPKAVSYFLLRDLENGIDVVREASSDGKFKFRTARELVRHQTTIDPGLKGCIESSRNGTKSLLWLQRTCRFMMLVMRGLKEGRRVDESCLSAYDSVLRPYHKWTTQRVASFALSTSVLWTRTQTSSEDILIERLESVSSTLHSILEEHGAVFEERM